MKSKVVILKQDEVNLPVIQAALSLGIRDLMIRPEALPKDIRSKVKIYGDFEGADVKIGKGGIVEVEIEKKEDVEAIARERPYGYLIKTRDWRIIPLENIIAMLEGTDVKLYVEAKNVEDAKTLVGVLEKGVDGIIISPKSVEELFSYTDILLKPPKLELKEAEVVDVKVVGMGERVCVDTSNMLEVGEGMLVGSFSGFLFLIHGETIGSEFTAPRPFRVNAGGVHNYILLPNGKTKYLSEVSSGDEVLIVASDGSTRRAVVGRSKIERRPLAVVKARADNVEGTVILQYAETIRLVSSKGEAISVTDLKPGDRVLVHIPSGPKGRHFGMAVEEYILEK